MKKDLIALLIIIISNITLLTYLGRVYDVSTGFIAYLFTWTVILDILTLLCIVYVHCQAVQPGGAGNECSA